MPTYDYTYYTYSGSTTTSNFMSSATFMDSEAPPTIWNGDPPKKKVDNWKKEMKEYMEKEK